MPPILTPQAFVAKWRKSSLKESAADREHFIDLCRLIGHATPAEADSTGATFTFQYGAARLDGKQGFADVFKRGCFGWEHKGKHANLDKAHQQLLQYRESLHNPPLLVVSDFERIVVYPNFVNRLNQPTTLTLDDLLTPAGLASLRAIFYDPAHFESRETRESVTQRMAGEFAQLADRLRGSTITLTNIYNARPTWLHNAHKTLDAAVFASYGWPSDLSDEAILERLLALNGERVKLS
jgi:hypothetical protein